MRGSSKILIVLVSVTAILAFTTFVSILRGLHKYDTTIKPFASFTRLNNLALGMDDYRQRNGQWPTNLAQLVSVRPDLGQDTTDAYGNIVILVPYNEKAAYGELISYGKDGQPGGTNRYDRDIIVRFPTDDKTNEQWNMQVRERTNYRK